MKYRFYFNFRRVNEKNKTKFVIHSDVCKCRHIKTNHNGFWTECYDEYTDAENSLQKLINKFRKYDFKIKPCKGIKIIKN